MIYYCSTIILMILAIYARVIFDAVVLFLKKFHR